MAEEYKLLKSQKNEVFKILQGAGLDPANFKWTRMAILDIDKVVPRLNYLDGKYFFEFMIYDDPDQLWCKFSPGKNHIVIVYKSGSWSDQKLNFNRWIMYLKREIEAPDLWDEIEKYRANLPLVSNEQLVNEPIPAYEAEEISSKLQLLADKIEEQFKLNEEQNQFVRSKLDYLADAAKRQPRRDWENIFIAVVINIAFQLALEPTKAQQFWQLVKSILGPFIHFIGS